MKEKFYEIYSNLLGSFKTGKDGFSARKVSAFAIIVMVIILHVKWFRSDRWEFITEVLGLDFFFILCCLGLATWQAVKEKTIDNEQK
jgi:hypothetical protein